MTVMEKEIERRLSQTVKKRGGLALKWVCPGWAGVPDRIVLLPGGRVYFIELKRPGGRTSERQRWWAEKLRDLGFDCYFLLSAEDVQHFEEFIAFRGGRSMNSEIETLRQRLNTYPGSIEKWKQETDLTKCTNTEKAELAKWGLSVEDLQAEGFDRGQVHHMLFGYLYADGSRNKAKFKSDGGGIALTADCKISCGSATWNTRLSQIGHDNAEVIIVTSCIRDFDYIEQIIAKRQGGQGITVVCGRCRTIELEHYYPSLRIIHTEEPISGTLVLSSTSTVWLSTVRYFGREPEGFHNTVGFHNEETYRYYREKIKKRFGV